MGAAFVRGAWRRSWDGDWQTKFQVVRLKAALAASLGQSIARFAHERRRWGASCNIRQQSAV